MFKKRDLTNAIKNDSHHSSRFFPFGELNVSLSIGLRGSRRIAILFTVAKTGHYRLFPRDSSADSSCCTISC